MATPAVAAAAVLVRQYLVEGWAAGGGAPNASASVPSPSAALVKAVLLGGAATMTGLLPTASGGGDGAPLDPAPSTRQGFGRAHLGRSLPLAPAWAAGWRLAVADGRALRGGGVDALCVRATGAAPVVATLVWTDRPPSPAAAVALVNDLDLVVVPPGAGAAPRLGNGGAAADRVNTVERVSLPPPVTPGDVRISVIGRSIPYGPQSYALAVHGGIEGGLRTGGSCPPPPPAITAPPPRVTNVSTVIIGFAAPDGGSVECRLSNEIGATTPRPLFPWKACTSPSTLTALPDGSYLFAVRAAGAPESGAVSAPFSVDTRPPAASITAASAPAAGTRRGAYFEFGAADASGASFECRLDRGAPAGAPPSPPGRSRVLGAAALGAWEPCTSPRAYGSLSNGAWTFRVRSADGAGNVQAAPYAARTWRVALPRHADLDGGDAGATVGQGGAVFSFRAVDEDPTAVGGAGVGAAAAVAADPSFTCSLAAWNATAAAYVPVVAAEPCTSPKAYTGLGPGLHLFSVALAGAGAPDLAAVATVSVDVAPPSVTLTATPPPYTADGSVTVAWTAPTAAAGTACALQGPGTDGSAFAACASPATLSNLPDGSYQFKVVAESAAGVRGPAATAAFVVDGAPPAAPTVRFADAEKAATPRPCGATVPPATCWPRSCRPTAPSGPAWRPCCAARSPRAPTAGSRPRRRAPAAAPAPASSRPCARTRRPRAWSRPSCSCRGAGPRLRRAGPRCECRPPPAPLCPPPWPCKPSPSTPPATRLPWRRAPSRLRAGGGCRRRPRSRSAPASSPRSPGWRWWWRGVGGRGEGEARCAIRVAGCRGAEQSRQKKGATPAPSPLRAPARGQHRVRVPHPRHPPKVHRQPAAVDVDASGGQVATHGEDEAGGIAQLVH